MPKSKYLICKSFYVVKTIVDDVPTSLKLSFFTVLTFSYEVPLVSGMCKDITKMTKHIIKITVQGSTLDKVYGFKLHKCDIKKETNLFILGLEQILLSVISKGRIF